MLEKWQEIAFQVEKVETVLLLFTTCSVIYTVAGENVSKYVDFLKIS